MECIICRESQEEMSDEHVIPDSLGGFYHIFTVCKGCNSTLGEKVDSPLVNHKLTELYRFVEEIEGKSGRIPNPFSGLFVEEGNPEVKARFLVDQDGKLDLSYHPLVKLHEKDGMVESIEIAVDTKDEDKIDEIIQKIIKRKGIPASALVKTERRRELRTGGVGGKWDIDILKFKIGLLKIAYEFAVDSIPGYYDDDDAVRISEILRDADYESVTQYVKIGSGLEPRVFEPFQDYLALDSKKHYLVLMPSEDGLLCFIKLHNLFSIGVVLSRNQFLDFTETLVGINDIDGKHFRKQPLVEIITACMGPLHTRFCYYFDNEEERARLQPEIDSPDFRYEGNEKDEIPLFQANGEKYPFLLHELLARSRSEVRKHEGWNIEVFVFDQHQPYYVKAVQSGHLLRVAAFEMSRQQVRKV